ncbi:MAG: hypothetical protein U1E92_06595 [Moraxella osloensis]
MKHTAWEYRLSHGCCQSLGFGNDEGVDFLLKMGEIGCALK